MTYLDEKIRHVINQAEKQETANNQNIYEGVIVNGQRYEFQEMAFFEDRLRIQIPTSFYDMPDELAQIKYPSSQRPQIIKTDNTGAINITLNLIANPITDKHIPEVKNNIKTIYKRLNPSILFFQEGVETVGEKPVGFIEFKSPALDESLYNLLFAVELDGSTMIGIFNCLYRDQRSWRPVARQIMKSVKITPTEQNQPTGAVQQ